VRPRENEREKLSDRFKFNKDLKFNAKMRENYSHKLRDIVAAEREINIIL
jgi:hypothetical protein